MRQIEEKLDEVLVKKAPYQLPEGAKKTLVQALPWLAGIGGVLMLLAAAGLWQWMTYSAPAFDTTDVINRTYGYVVPSGYEPLLWTSIGLLVAEAAMLFMAFPGLQAHKKSGWNLIFWASLLNIAQALLYLFVNWQVVPFVFSLLVSAASLYLLFQVRSYYSAAGTPTPPPSTPPSNPPKPPADSTPPGA